MNHVGNYWRQNGSNINAKFILKFTRTRLRLLAPVYNTHSNSISIYVDGNLFQSSQHPSTIGNSGETILIFEITDLNEGMHTVEVRNNKGKYYALDAIDIDENGVLFHPDEVTNIEDLDIGRRIRCHYSTTVNQAGTFSEMGREIYLDGINDFIPPESSNAPNGTFYFICVDKDYLERWKLIADRNIQHSISWDALNNAGYVNEQENENLPFGIIRLMTGGISSNDKNNEWGRYIVNSDLGGKISPGDNNVWNWKSIYTLTSTQP